jgi:hypothetical protein
VHAKSANMTVTSFNAGTTCVTSPRTFYATIITLPVAESTFVVSAAEGETRVIYRPIVYSICDGVHYSPEVSEEVNRKKRSRYPRPFVAGLCRSGVLIWGGHPPPGFAYRLVLKSFAPNRCVMQIKLLRRDL